MSHDFLARLVRVLCRPKGLALIFSAAACAAAVIWLVPQDQYPLAAVLIIGLGAPLLVITIHSLALTRWTGRLQKTIEYRSSGLRPLSEAVARLEAYTHASDLNVARIATLQNSLEARFEKLSDELRELNKFGPYLRELE